MRRASMRTIKFRGRRLDNGEWAIGSLISVDDTAFIVDKSEIDYDPNTDIYAFWFDNQECIVDPATVGQSTGMCDKNDKEIYEGDVFHYTNEDGDDCISEVKYDDEDGCFNIADSSYIYGVNYAIKHMNAHLIGNIHDNPELLKTE